MLSEISQKQMLYDFTCIKARRRVKFIETNQNRGHWGIQGMRSYCLMATELLFEMMKSSGNGWGDGCTTLNAFNATELHT